MNHQPCRSSRSSSRATVVAIVLGFVATRSPSQADDRFFPITSKSALSGTSLGIPSTNERGDIVFRLITASERSIRMVRGVDQIAAANENTILPTFTVRTSSGTLASFSTINATGSVLTYNLQSGLQIVQRLDPSDPSATTGPGTYLSQAIARSEVSQTPPNPFSFVSPIGGIADNGLVHFYGERTPLGQSTLLRAIYASSTEVTAPATVTPLASTDTGYSAIDGYVACSSNGTYGTWRGTGPSGLGIYASGNHPGASASAGFTNTGLRPSVNPLGHLAFSSTYQPASGPSQDGVFIRHLSGSLRRVGNLANSGDLLAPVGIQPAAYTANSGDRVALNDFGQVLFAANDALGRRTLYTTSLGRCRPLLSVGDQIQLAGGTHEVSSLSLFDGLKTNGQAVFSITTTGGQEFALRANRGFSQAKLSDSPITPSYASTKYLLRSIAAEETRLNAPLIAAGKTPPTGRIKAIGCNLTSTANLLTAYGHNVSAGELQSWLVSKWQSPPAGRSREDYLNTETNDLKEGAVALYSLDRQVLVPQAPVVQFIGTHNPGAAGALTNLQKLVSEIRQGYPVKVRVPNGDYGVKPYESFGHYVLAYGLKDPGKLDPLDAFDILICDPGNGGIYTLGDYGSQLPKAGGVKYSTSHPSWLEDNAGGRRRLHLYRPIGSGITLPSTMNLALATQPGPVAGGARSIVGSRANFLITDSLGRRLGTGSDGTDYNEIPGGSFSVEEPYTGLDGDEGELDDAWEGYSARYNLNLSELPDGSYMLTVTAVDSIKYALETGATGSSIGINPQTGSLTPGQSFSTQIVVGFVAGDDSKLTFEKVDAVTGKVTIFGRTGLNYQLRSSTNLHDWTNVGTPRSGTNAKIEWTIPITAGARVFYRTESSSP